MHCIDPLKNFLTCGSACPPACGRFSPACSFQCVSGCFCRTPYVLSDVQNANSACILPQHCDLQGSFDRATLPESDFPSEKTTTSGPAFTEELTTTISTTTESIFEPISIPPTKPSTSSSSSSSTLPPITCADKNKDFQNCGSSCPLACDNLDAQNCSPCVSGCFCKNGYVFESVKNWTKGHCIKIEDCSRQNSKQEDSTSTTTATTETTESSQMAGIETIGAQLFTTDSHQEIGRIIFSTSVDQKIQFNARITFLPKSKSKIFVIAIHKYGALATDTKCEAIGDVIEINPAYSYPFPNGTLLYLQNPKIPYAATYTFKASNDFAEKSVGAVIGRSVALHEFSVDGNLGEPLGCATVGILQS
uniref:TIL domain-containing protein n=1 Tax=Panagrolaimus superbus TaxID=310955 RepID=A0A914Y940_9BILA